MNKVHVITDVGSLHEFSEMAHISARLNFNKYKSEAVADLAVNSEDADCLKWLLKQDSFDSYLAQV